MQKRIYRFEIVCGVANAVYQARDTARGSSVTLYEWTPAAQELDGCLKVLNGLAKSEEFEVFSSGASLYLAAATDQAGEAGLRRLRAAGLFNGTFAGPVAATPPPPPPPPATTIRPAKPAGSGNAAIRTLLVMIPTVTLIIFFLFGLRGC